MKQPISTLTDDLQKIDQDIVSSFPALDSLNPQIKGNGKERVKTYLKVLKALAEKTVEGRAFITKYDLTQSKGFPRLGGQTAQEVLIELEKLNLLRTHEAKSKKKTPKKEKRLTAKGVIACMIFSEFQKTDKLTLLLQNGPFQGDKLATLLKVYNDGFGQRQLVPQKTLISPCLPIIVKLGSKSAIESLSDEFIISNLRLINDQDFLAQINKPITDLMWSSFQDCNKNQAKELLQGWLSLIDTYSFDANEVKEGKELQSSALLLFTSPEFLAWMVMSQNKRPDIEQAMNRIKEGLVARVPKFGAPDNPLEVLNAFNVFRDLVLEELSQA